jgi:hypothetical protein
VAGLRDCGVKAAHDLESVRIEPLIDRGVAEDAAGDAVGTNRR